MLRLQDAATCNSARSGSAEVAVSCATSGDEVSDIEGLIQMRDLPPLYIFDLDGTLALIEHRRHFVECERGSQNWNAFYEACENDEPNTPVLKIMWSLRLIGAEIWIFSGRSDQVREKTLAWLRTYAGFGVMRDPVLQMREEGDFTPDDVLKKKWLDSMLKCDINRLVAVFDDRDRVVKMWRDNGVTCLQVAKGEF